MKLIKETEKWTAYFEDPDYGQLKNETYSEKKYKAGLLVFDSEETDCFQEDRTSKKREIFYDERNRIKKELITEFKDIGTGIIEIYEITFDYNGNSYRKTKTKKFSGYKDVLERNNGDIQFVDNLKEVDEIEEIYEVKYQEERKKSERFFSSKNENSWTTEYNYKEDVLDNYYLESIIGPHEIDGLSINKSYFKYQNGKLIKEKHFNKESVMLLYKEHKDGELILSIEYVKISYDIKSPDYRETRLDNNLITDVRYYRRKAKPIKGEKNELKSTKNIKFIYDANKNIISKKYYHIEKNEHVLFKQEKTTYDEFTFLDKVEGVAKNLQLPVEIITLVKMENGNKELNGFEATSKIIKIYDKQKNSINLIEEQEFSKNKLLKQIFIEYKNNFCSEKRTRFFNENDNYVNSSEFETFDYNNSGNITYQLKIKVSENEIVNKTTNHFFYEKG